MRSRRSLVWLVAGMAALAGCDLVRDAASPDAGLDGPPPPRDDLVPAVGGPATLDLAAWNIENFPKSDAAVARVADLVTSLDLDLVVVQEIGSVAAWDELMARLPEHEGLLSTHRYTPTSYQKLGLIYRVGAVEVGAPELLFTDDSWAFPRPPFKVHVSAAGYSMDLIGVHLKAGGEESDGDRRALAAQKLDAHVRAQVAAGGEDEVVVLGDYNEVVTSAEGRARLAPLLDPASYRLRTQEAADAGEHSFVPTPGRVIDHVLTTVGLEEELGDRAAIIPRVDRELLGYEDQVTDHLPVVLLMPHR